MKRLVQSFKSSTRSGKSSTPPPPSSDLFSSDLLSSDPLSTGEIDAVVDLSRYIKKNGEHCVGGGRFGDVYKGIRLDTPDLIEEDRRVAIKVIRPLMVRDDVKSKAIKRLKREIAVWQGLAHKNVVPFLGISYSFGSMPALISVWMENGQLDVYLSEHPRVDRSAIAEGIASGLLYLHTRDPKIIHGDVKTANTLVDRAGNARLCDFGLSRMMAEDDLWMTTTVNSRGSVRWMAPELLEGRQVLPTLESDVYAFAMTILEMLTGRIPFHHHRSDHAVLTAILFQKEIPSLPTDADEFGLWQVDLDALWECLTRCWDVGPGRRPSVAVVRELLRSGTERSAIDMIPSEPFIGHEDLVSSVAFSPCGKQIVSGSADKTVRVWDAKTGEALFAPFVGHTGWVTSVAFSRDGKRIASGSMNKTVRVCNAQTGLLFVPLRGHTDSVSSVAFSPEGNRIVSGSDDLTVRVWNAETGEALFAPLKGHTDFVKSVAFSPDGAPIASGSWDMTVRVWNAETGEALHKPFKGHFYSVGTVAFSPDGKKIASGSHDERVRIWDAERGEVIFPPCSGHTDYVTSVSFSGESRLIASGSFDKTVRVWDAETGEALFEPFRGHTDFVNSVAFSPAGKRIVSGSKDKTLRVWNAEMG